MRSLEEEGSSWDLGDRAGHLRSSGKARGRSIVIGERGEAGTASALMMFGFYCKWKGNH